MSDQTGLRWHKNATLLKCSLIPVSIIMNSS
jgi:hypothetical protein